ncbi:hypothetical protein Tco_1251493 [Tanacetum coccineum]
MSVPWSAEGSNKDGDEVGSGMGKSGGVLDGGVSALVWESMICGGGEWEVDGASALSRIMEALGDDHGESGDGGGVGISRSLATFISDQNGVGGSSQIDILAVTRYARCGGGVAADLSVSNGSVSSADRA